MLSIWTSLIKGRKIAKEKRELQKMSDELKITTKMPDKPFQLSKVWLDNMITLFVIVFFYYLQKSITIQEIKVLNSSFSIFFWLEKQIRNFVHDSLRGSSMLHKNSIFFLLWLINVLKLCVGGWVRLCVRACVCVCWCEQNDLF